MRGDRRPRERGRVCRLPGCAGVTTRALDVIGADAASARHGFDRFWRNARTHTLREPVAHRLREVGDYFLNGAHPPFALPA
ncbi:hypothetical protein [Streptomyces sp. NPDC046859]|uniref:hypothetical protein n=1 Tax=Streptomyces sp. NPDC046859 TaxID=3155734 RepID=UPI0033F31238